MDDNTNQNNMMAGGDMDDSSTQARQASDEDENQRDVGNSQMYGDMSDGNNGSARMDQMSSDDGADADEADRIGTFDDMDDDM